MKVAVTGSSGFLGTALVARLEAEGHHVLRLLRPGAKAVPGSAYWNPQNWTIDADALEGVDAVIHLAGAGIGLRPWTRRYKEKILRSRVDGTRLVAGTLAGLDQPPKVLLSASAIGFYGDRGDEVLTEASPPGKGFRSEVCRQWEAATVAAGLAGIRVVHLRFGIVLGAGGGLLPVLLIPARLGLGTRLGSGRQYVSWISLADAIGAVAHLIGEESVAGPINVTSPNPVTSREFARTLSVAVHRPRLGWAPAWFLRLVAGKERSQEVLLSSQRATPGKLLASGFAFEHEDLPSALEKLIERSVR